MTQVLQLLIPLWCLHFCLAADVIQNPKLQSVHPMKNVSLTCEHHDTSQYTKYWYRQEKGKELVLIGYTSYEEKATMEKGFEDGRINIHPESVTRSILNISKVSIQDSAVYYCASSDGQLEPERTQTGPKVKIFRPSRKELKDHNLISVVCVASEFYPEHVRIRWFVNDKLRENLYDHVPKNNSVGSFSTFKRLTLTRSEYFNPDATFKCEAAFIDGTQKDSYQINGETDCGVSKEKFGMSINQGKISYIMVLCKSGVYGLIVLAVVWRKKVISGSC